jgi:hypothetical protein
MIRNRAWVVVAVEPATNPKVAHRLVLAREEPPTDAAA